MTTHLGWDMQFVQWLMEHQKEAGVFRRLHDRLDAGGQSRQ